MYGELAHNAVPLGKLRRIVVVDLDSLGQRRWSRSGRDGRLRESDVGALGRDGALDAVLLAEVLRPSAQGARQRRRTVRKSRSSASAAPVTVSHSKLGTMLDSAAANASRLGVCRLLL